MYRLRFSNVCSGICAVTAPWEATLIGVVGGLIGAKGDVVMIKMKIDDPVAAVPIHGFCAIWGLLACGLFTRRDTVDNTFSTRDGLFWVKLACMDPVSIKRLIELDPLPVAVRRNI